MSLERYAIEYRDARGRWHRARERFDTAGAAMRAASAYPVWRVVDAAGNRVAGDSGMAYGRRERGRS